MEAGKIILFDGVCNYCNSMVNLVIRRDKKDRFRFAALQSSTGSYIRHKYKVPETIDSFIYIENDKVYLFSTAALKVSMQLGGLWPLLAVFFIVPRFIRDRIYKWVAANRYIWFGKRDSCMVPTPEVRAKFLN
ncbi:MAG: thiol-disulfide oxidoreductase DCC family protein [Ferruginibacter sp.]